MALLSLRNIQLSFGADPLLQNLDLSIDPGERLCLVGRNGAGKSTLMKIIAGEIQPDDGEIEARQGLKTARLIQEVPANVSGSIFDVVADGLGEMGELLRRHHHLVEQLGDADEKTYSEFEKVQEQIEAKGAWDLAQRVDTVLSRLQLDGDMPFSSLSGGMKRRVLLGQTLVQEPDILLLDEPTNHLDIDAINWLEEFLRSCGITQVFITHDRSLVRALATRIIELDRGRLTSWPGSYEKYLEGKEAALASEEKTNAEFDKKLSREEAWIRQGIKARRTRNEGRVRALQQMRRDFAARRNRQGTARLEIQSSDNSGKVVIEAEDLWQEYEGRELLNGFSTTIMRGDRIGILGRNGCGKSTLLKILLQKIEPQRGTVKHGSKLQVAVFDQLRELLDEEKSVVENVAEGSDTLTINGKSKHVMGYLQDFLFEPGRARQPVKALSGGERNRLLLAKLFTRPFNLLVLDEPTNDLDSETLELLEDQLMQFNGTLLLVSHDREFIDNVVTSTIVFENDQVNQYVGGYQDWLRQRPTTDSDSASNRKSGKNAPPPPQKTSRDTDRAADKKLTYAEELQLQELPGKIEVLETRIAELQKIMAAPGFFDGPQETVENTTRELADTETELEAVFGQWSELEERRDA